MWNEGGLQSNIPHASIYIDNTDSDRKNMKTSSKVITIFFITDISNITINIATHRSKSQNVGGE